MLGVHDTMQLDIHTVDMLGIGTKKRKSRKQIEELERGQVHSRVRGSIGALING